VGGFGRHAVQFKDVEPAGLEVGNRRCSKVESAEVKARMLFCRGVDGGSTKLGVALTAVGDHGELFTLAVIVVLCSAGILILHRRQLAALIPLTAQRS
jgi:hypothetical protein